MTERRTADSGRPTPASPGERDETPKSVSRPRTSTRLTAVEIGQNVLAAAHKEFARPSISLFWSSLASGLAIGFSFVLGGYLMTLAPAGYEIAAAALAYPVGFILVIMARSELFTENTLTPIWAVLERRDLGSVLNTLRVWAILLVGNLLGTLVFSAVVAWTPMVPESLLAPLDRLAEHAVTGGFSRTMYQGIFAGWLIALLTWMLASTTATGAQLALIWLLTWAIAALGFTHAIVGSVEAFYLALRGLNGWGATLLEFVLPAVLGNAIGGVLLVALLNYGQVAPEVFEERVKDERQETREQRGRVRP